MRVLLGWRRRGQSVKWEVTRHDGSPYMIRAQYSCLGTPSDVFLIHRTLETPVHAQHSTVLRVPNAAGPLQDRANTVVHLPEGEVAQAPKLHGLYNSCWCDVRVGGEEEGLDARAALRGGGEVSTSLAR